MAVALLQESSSLAEAATALSARCGISKRQAYRYTKEAETAGKQLPVPDQKIAFTVKLSQNLTQALRQYAQVEKQTLSDIVTQALEAFLYRDQRRGSAEEKDSQY